MSTTKTVNVTTGKVLHYTIKKAGYKTVVGSKLITGPETINVNMVSESSSQQPFVFGDRIGGVASFFMYFDSVNPDTSATQKYACFVLDAQYRNANCSWVNNSAFQHQWGDASSALNDKQSATYATDRVFNNTTPSGSNYPEYFYARNPGGQSLIITVDGVNYVPQLPSVAQIQQIAIYKTSLDQLDPTLSSYSSLGLVNWGFNNGNVQGNTLGWGGGKWVVKSSGSVDNNGGPMGIIPIFEIPVN